MKLVFCLLLTAYCLLPVAAQNKPAAPAKVEAQAPQLKTEELLKIRDLQVAQLQRALQMKEIEELHAKLEAENAAGIRAINAAIVAGAKAGGIDLEKWIFNLDTLKFVERPKAPAAPEKK